ncbi:hypothetical protein FHT03_000479 [Xanthomonas arboricola]|nr:hypothetical protein [Xanthomonas cannabis]
MPLVRPRRCLWWGECVAHAALTPAPLPQTGEGKGRAFVQADGMQVPLAACRSRCRSPFSRLREKVPAGRMRATCTQ